MPERLCVCAAWCPLAIRPDEGLAGQLDDGIGGRGGPRIYNGRALLYQSIIDGIPGRGAFCDLGLDKQWFAQTAKFAGSTVIRRLVLP